MDTFGDPSYFSYFVYAFFVCVLGLLVSHSAFIRQDFHFQISLPGVFFLLLVLYVLIHGFVTETLWLTHFYWVTNAILLLAVGYWTSSIDNKKLLQLIFKGILFFGVIESLIVIMQFANMVPSASKYFEATGTWVNPNVTAMFLAMVSPILIVRLLAGEGLYKKLYFLFLLIVIVALMFLKCRTAIIGTVVGSGIILNSHYDFMKKIRFKHHVLKVVLLGSLAIILVTATGYVLYKSKQDSADGRKLIWKISTAMIAEKPVTGYGYGSFEKSYNLFQADYFAEGNGTEQEKANASFVHMAYNEFLQSTVEGGVIGFILFVLLLGSLLLGGWRKVMTLKKESGITPFILSFAGICSFAVMSVFNFTMQAIPVVALFILYISIAGEHYPKIYFDITNKSFKRFALGSFMVLILVFGVYQTSLANAYSKNKIITRLINEGKTKYAIAQLKLLQNDLKKEDGYWINYGNAWYRQKEYNKAIDNYREAINVKPTCDAYMILAQCYQKMNNTDSAINACIAAKNMAPNRMLPTFALMQVYTGINDTLRATAQARELIEIKPKVKSQEAMFYKFKATQLLKQFKSIETIN